MKDFTYASARNVGTVEKRIKKNKQMNISYT